MIATSWVTAPGRGVFPIPGLLIMDGRDAFDAGTPYRPKPKLLSEMALELWRQGWRDAFVERIASQAETLIDAAGHRAAGQALDKALDADLARDGACEQLWLAVAHEIMVTQALYRT